MTDTPSPSTNAEQEPTTAAPAPRRKFLDLSMTQVIAGSMAAATAAALGSKLGVAGTIIGAAMASLIAAVASAIYTASLARTQHGVRQVLRRTTVQPRPGEDAAPTTTPETATLQPADARTGWFAGARGQQVRGVLVGAIGAFAIAAVGITGYEFVSGNSVSGGDGTTIQRVIVHRPVEPSADPGEQVGGSEESPSADRSEDSTTEPTEPAEPSEAPSSDESSDSPTDAPTSTTPSEDPTGSTEPTPEESTPATDPTEAPGSSTPPTEPNSGTPQQDSSAQGAPQND